MMSTKSFYSSATLAIVCFFVLHLTACFEDTEAIVQQKVSERVTVFKAKKSIECRAALLERAERVVDSLLLTEAQNSLNDSLARRRPGRPYQPPAIPPIDSFTVKPIFDQFRPASQNGG